MINREIKRLMSLKGNDTGCSIFKMKKMFGFFLAVSISLSPETDNSVNEIYVEVHLSIYILSIHTIKIGLSDAGPI